MYNKFDERKGLLQERYYDEKFLGVCTGTVIDNKDPDQMGRVKLKLAWLKHQEADDEDFTTDWCRVRCFYAGNERGNLWVPETDDEVLVGFEHGYMRIPYVIGRLWNGKDKPMQDAPTDPNDNKWIQSRLGHQLIFKEAGPAKIECFDGPQKNYWMLNSDDDCATYEAKTGCINIFAKNGVVNFDAKTIKMHSSANTEWLIDGDYKLEQTGSTTKFNISTLYDIQSGSTMSIKVPTRLVDPANSLKITISANATIDNQLTTIKAATMKIEYGMCTKDLAQGGKQLEVQGKLAWTCGMFDAASLMCGMKANASASFTGTAMFELTAMKGAKVYSGGPGQVQGAAMVMCKGSAVWVAG